jgi:hypothetical protein
VDDIISLVLFILLAFAAAGIGAVWLEIREEADLGTVRLMDAITRALGKMWLGGTVTVGAIIGLSIAGYILYHLVVYIISKFT